MQHCTTMKKIIDEIKKIEHGFKHIVQAGDSILAAKTQKHFDLAVKFLADDTYQVRIMFFYLTIVINQRLLLCIPHLKQIPGTLYEFRFPLNLKTGDSI